LGNKLFDITDARCNHEVQTLALSVIKTNQLMLYKHINALCRQNVEFLNVKPGGRPTEINQKDLKD
jgi:hypothetical protein